MNFGFSDINFYLSSIMVITISFFSNFSFAGDGAFLSEPDQRIEIYNTSWSDSIPPPDSYYYVQGAYQHDVKEGHAELGFKGLVPYVKFMHLRQERFLSAKYGDNVTESLHYFSVFYPSLSKGDIVPMFNKFYRIEELKRNQHKPLETVVVVQVNKDNLPNILNIQPDSFVIIERNFFTASRFPFKKVLPIGKTRTEQNMIIYVIGIREKSKESPVSASIEMGYYEEEKKDHHPNLLGLRPKKLPVESAIKRNKVKKFKNITVGDRLEHGGGTIVIRNIVPANSKFKLIGYVEIGIEGLSKLEKNNRVFP